jgi:excisionase family DNA binding protein
MDHILTLKEVAAWLQVHETSIRKLLKARAIPAFKVGSDWRFHSGDLELWLEQITGTSRHSNIRDASNTRRSKRAPAG